MDPREIRRDRRERHFSHRFRPPAQVLLTLDVSRSTRPLLLPPICNDTRRSLLPNQGATAAAECWYTVLTTVRDRKTETDVTLMLLDRDSHARDIYAALSFGANEIGRMV